MKTLRRAALWSWLLTKRLLKKPIFPILLLCVPLLAGAMALAARQESGIVTVALVCETDEPVARRSMERLLKSGSLVRFTVYASEAEARAAVERADVEAAWLLRGGAEETLQKFVTGRRTKGLAVVVEREDNVFLRLAREQLAAALYPEASYALFRDHLIRALGASEDTPEETFESYFSTQVADQPVIVFASADGSAREDAPSYLVAPVRGLLALLLVLTGLASAMYCYADAERGTFLRLPEGKRRLLPLLCHLCALVPVAAASLLALYAAGLLTGWAREAGLALLYCASVAAFCELLRKLCRDETRLGALTPALLAAMLALCPVFFDWKLPEPLQMAFPTFYYLKGAYSGRYVWLLLGYTAAVAALAVLLPERND